MLTVYRGQQLAASELEAFKVNINRFISLNSFWSTTKDKDVALMYAGNGLERPLIESVLFEMLIEINTSEKPLADISKISYMLDENEVLLTMGTIFRIADTSLPQNHPDKAVIHECIGSVYLDLGKYDQAIKSYETGLEIDQETLPIDHPSSASSHINIGHAYDMNGKYDVALDHYKKAHDILINRGTIGRTKLATVLGNMGVIHKIRKQFCPACSKDIAITYSNIAVVYAKMKSTAKAIEYQQKAIEIVRGSQIPNDPVLALLYNNMGKNYADLGNTERALYYYNLSLDIKYSYLPPNHPTIGVTFSNIAIMLIASGDLKMALHYFEKALQIFVQSFGVDHPIRVGCVEDMALLRTVMDISEY
ncbi:unnamed protein product [Rotaria sordida]|uniref:Uncharacterized protein n=1 Tax=Rotaria sordida TaxID=392033 RepID=A0A820BCR6_9BILA|nr:unnamed protein product [Rotaria sordida]